MLTTTGQPILVNNITELAILGQKLRRMAIEEPFRDAPQYTKEEAVQFLNKVEEWQKAHPNAPHPCKSTLVAFLGHFVSICVSFDTYHDPEHPGHRWHVSLCEQVPIKEDERCETRRIPDGPAKAMAEAILGGGADEIPTTAKVIKDIREFVRVAE